MVTRAKVRTWDGDQFRDVVESYDPVAAIRDADASIAKSADEDHRAWLTRPRDDARGIEVARAVADALVVAGLRVDTVESTVRHNELTIAARWQHGGKRLDLQQRTSLESIDAMIPDAVAYIAQTFVAVVAKGTAAA